MGSLDTKKLFTKILDRIKLRSAANGGTDPTIVTTGEKYTWNQKVDTVSGKGLSTEDYTTAEKTKLSGIATGATKVEIDSTLTTSGKAADAKGVGDKIKAVNENLDNLTEYINAKKYGVSGIGQSASALTRLWDAVGMTAQVGTDGDNSNVVNDFDNAGPWKIRKCVGRWYMEGDRAVFRPNAYYGDANYKEDGSMGDYVAVEYPLSYYYLKNGVLGISTFPHEGYRPFDIFCHDHNPQDTIPFYYAPAYALALDGNNHAVSLPGYDNEQGSYYDLMTKARTYDGGSLGNLAILMPMSFSFYLWALMTVEFAVQNTQSIMAGCSSLRHNGDDRVTMVDSTHFITSNYQAGRVAGEYISIISTSTDINSGAYLASHKITDVLRCDENGNASSSGTHQMLTVEDLGRSYFEYTVGTDYRIAARPYRNGACSGVSTPSGSPVNNTNGYYPMKYRHKENAYGNQYSTVADFFNKRVGTGDDDYYLEHYYLPDPSEYTPSGSSKPDATDLATSVFKKIFETPHSKYVSGYIKSVKYSEEYPDVWIPDETSGGSASTYFADYAYLVASNVVRAVRLFGHWSSGSYDGPSHFYGNSAPSTSSAPFGGDLYVIQ